MIFSLPDHYCDSKSSCYHPSELSPRPFKVLILVLQADFGRSPKTPPFLARHNVTPAERNPTTAAVKINTEDLEVASMNPGFGLKRHVTIETETLVPILSPPVKFEVTTKSLFPKTLPGAKV